MKILIVIPSRSYRGQPGYVDFPDEMLSLAVVLESPGHKIKFVDFNVERLPPDTITQFQPDLAVFYVSTGPEIADALNKSREYKKLGIKIAWCGCHPTALPEQTLAADCVDYVICGGAEMTITELADSLLGNVPSLSSILGLGYKDEFGSVRINESRPPLADADSLPDPAWHLVDFQRYPDTNLNTSRGGPYACTFFPDLGECRISLSGKLSPGRILSQMRKMRQEYGARHVYFSGCGLAADGARFKDFCRIAIRQKLKTGWTLPVSSGLDEETVRLMARAGCVSVLLDVGSGSPRLRQFLKMPDIEEVEKAFQLLVRHKIIPTLLVNHGYPTESAADFQETLDLLVRLDQPPVLFLKYIPYPGTEQFDLCVDQGLVSVPLSVAEWAEFVPGCMARNLSQVHQEHFNRALAEFRQTYASRRVRFMVRHNPGYFLALIRKPREFFKRLKDLFRYYAEAVRQRKIKT
jgi:radical SAM superfamily enzyme YgiQ (UPF0313 family)